MRYDTRRAALGVLLAAGVWLPGAPGYAATPVPLSGEVATTAAFEDRLDAALQRMLDAVVGPGRSSVTVHAELDHDQVTTTTTTYTRDPAIGALSENLSRRSFAGSDGTTRYEAASTARTQALDAVHRTRSNAPGDIEKLAVAVIVDAAAPVDLAAVRELVGAAAGVDPGRGDTVVVTALPLHAAARPAAASAIPEQAPLLAQAAERPAVLAGALLALLLLTAALLVRLRKAGRADPRKVGRAGPPSMPDRAPITVTAVLGAPVSSRAPGTLSAGPPPSP
ncbi:flagellar M-ring protein FliF C-terminal domain-containing protein [Actinoplanes sp. DH11]|uniref:flagellar M-ring protein FliF C-terminal domain-containing protein n=1 Tax=Actinoplanes sp. DH11 TaxID=2857011 RepID=UPI001E4F0E57|nr:flagellar M-ring protein FliF C-terminal domain-containing protein [Actinoplanes sp. DH11]